MVALQSGPSDKRIYRFSPWFLFVYRIQAAAAILFGALLVARHSDGLLGAIGPKIPDWTAGGALLLGAVYLLARASGSAVIDDRDTVSVRGMWSTRTLPKNAVLGFKTTWDRVIAYTTFVPKSSTDMLLAIEKFYSFDEEWERWISNLPDLGKKHTLGLI